ncbi:LacI family DNA-binding transcriptional regulator [Microbacterium sp. EYE_5]|uniref:LacI family DNA-binding transcriptional regulator n=1 Tax=unclassified Microbacterium TaxID=2609290 RepID=UPI0020041E81|nr:MULTISPECIES: LacI family DNA-binding transcriptional regulator [unclassified Microbacterium]MCK6079317.1 LacI family DNA-binding transcriptional regulator [Microbacterium sp. EYE_382]MCK6084587.1 LacI family DNA-binding transcriptional regulator [Microbacterium sp. EYE_384]MCK6123184.1 LacI family DNA-binding transcriptional regulator [Microbacterium sp. EYE_80]MCK6125351.1 LacI family DNA-binding transcriptional regulator [Microbacterium sp. EYE_79]MCK6140271.1 LacI family DNA-binding tra
MTDERIITTTGRPTRRSTQSVTLNEVAMHAGVSPQTVSRAIRRPDLVSQDTLERVLASISATGYVPNLAASNLASNRSYTVAAIIPAINASVFADALQGLDEVLAEQGYHLFIGSTEYDPTTEEALIRAFLGRRPDGIFIVGTVHTPAARDLLARARVPIVETWNWTDDPIDGLVGFSNADAVRAVVEYAHEQGYRHPTFAGRFADGDSRAIDRRDAFTSVASHLYPGETPRVLDSGDLGVSMDAGKWLLDQALTRHPETDVLICASDVFAAGAVLECQRRGIRVPEDFGITGFGGFEIARHLVPTLTTVAIPNRRIGTVAGEMLLARMADGSTPAPRIDLGFEIVAGESTRTRTEDA